MNISRICLGSLIEWYNITKNITTRSGYDVTIQYGFNIVQCKRVARVIKAPIEYWERLQAIEDAFWLDATRNSEG